MEDFRVQGEKEGGKGGVAKSNRPGESRARVPGAPWDRPYVYAHSKACYLLVFYLPHNYKRGFGRNSVIRQCAHQREDRKTSRRCLFPSAKKNLRAVEGDTDVLFWRRV